MKNLLMFILIVAVAGLYFHDKQQTTDLNKALEDNTQLQQQLASYESAYGQLRARDEQIGRNMALQPLQQSAPAPTAAGSWGLQTGHLQDSGGLDRPPYNN